MFKKETKLVKRYYIKKDGVVTEVTAEKYNLFKEKLKMLKKQYLCPNCKECLCEKIRYSDINKCEEVNVATYKLVNNKYIDPKTGKQMYRYEVDEFIVFDCNKFNLYSHLVQEQDGTIHNKKTEEENINLKSFDNKEQLEKKEIKEKEKKEQEEKKLKNKEILENVRKQVREKQLMLEYDPLSEKIQQQSVKILK